MVPRPAGCGCACHTTANVHHVAPCCSAPRYHHVPTLTAQQAETARLVRLLFVPAPPEDDIEDPEYGF